MTRMRIAGFITTEQTLLYLAAPATNDVDLWQRAAIAFEPFSVSLWAVTVAFVVWLSVLLTLQENSDLSAHPTRRAQAAEMARRIGQAVYTGSVGFLGTPA